MEQQPGILQQVTAPMRPVDPRASYDGQSFLADRTVDLVYVKRDLSRHGVINTNPDGLINITHPLGLQPNPFYQPALPIQFK